MDPLEKVIRPIVEGQIADFITAHPEVVNAVDWYKPRKDRRTTLINSLAKRIVRDLCCPIVRGRLAAALLAGPTEAQPDATVEAAVTASRPAGLALASEPAGDAAHAD